MPAGSRTRCSRIRSSAARGRRLGSVVHREELTRLLLYFADDSATLEQDVKAELKQALVRNGISDPGGTLRKIRDVSLQLEAANPHLAVDVRQTMAILQEARSDFVAKINNSFDQAIDRVAQRFTASTRAITFVAALLVAGALQVDTIGLVNRLSADDMLRQAFVTQRLRSRVPLGRYTAQAPMPAARTPFSLDRPRPQRKRSTCSTWRFWPTTG